MQYETVTYYGKMIKLCLPELLFVLILAKRAFYVSTLKFKGAFFAIALAAIPVSATTVSFDDLGGSGNQMVPNGYAGLNWTNFFVYDATNDPAGLNPSGYQYGVISPNNVAFNGFGNSAAVSNTLFDLNSAYLTSVWRDNLQVEVRGSLLAVPLYDNTYTLSATAPTLINFNYLGVDSVEFSIFSGGTHHPGYDTFDGTQFALDNLNVAQAVPEPSTWLAAALTFGAIFCSQRKRLRFGWLKWGGMTSVSSH